MYCEKSWKTKGVERRKWLSAATLGGVETELRTDIPYLAAVELQLGQAFLKGSSDLSTGSRVLGLARDLVRQISVIAEAEMCTETAWFSLNQVILELSATNERGIGCVGPAATVFCH